METEMETKKVICAKRGRFLCTLDKGHTGPHGSQYRRDIKAEKALEASFEDARKELPIPVIGNFDPLTHKTVADLVYIAQHELDLYAEGEDTDIRSTVQAGTVREFIAKYSR